MIGWMLMDAMLDRGVRATNLCMGAIVGLVAITPAAGYVNAGAAALTGIIASICCSLTQ
jgi:Amt family ammonium transporter